MSPQTWLFREKLFQLIFYPKKTAHYKRRLVTYEGINDY